MPNKALFSVCEHHQTLHNLSKFQTETISSHTPAATNHWRPRPPGLHSSRSYRRRSRNRRTPSGSQPYNSASLGCTKYIQRWGAIGEEIRTKSNIRWFQVTVNRTSQSQVLDPSASTESSLREPGKVRHFGNFSFSITLCKPVRVAFLTSPSLCPAVPKLLPLPRQKSTVSTLVTRNLQTSAVCCECEWGIEWGLSEDWVRDWQWVTEWVTRVSDSYNLQHQEDG